MTEAAYPMDGRPPREDWCEKTNHCPECQIDLTVDNNPRCTATSRQSGHRCGRAMTPGATVCAYHGSGAVRRRAQLRLIDLVGPATEKLEQVLTTSTDERVVLKAVEMVYDRTGLPARVEISSDMAREIVLHQLQAIRARQDFIDVESTEVPSEVTTGHGLDTGRSVENDADSGTKVDTEDGF